MAHHLAWIPVLALLTGEAAASEAAPLLKLASSGFEESFSQAGRLARDLPRDPMRTLVGLQFGVPRGQFHIDQVGVMLSPDATPAEYCVRFLSQDARYRAVNPYEKSRDKGAAPKVETRSTLAATLESEFASDQIVTRIIAGAGCSDSKRGAIVPALPPGDDNSSVLTVFLNVPGDAFVKLMSKNTQVGRADCDPVSSRINTYNRICKLSSPDPHADSIKVTALEDSGPHEEVYPILWSRR